MHPVFDTNRILKETEEKMLSGKDYRHIEVDLNSKPFLDPIDADNTKASVYYVRNSSGMARKILVD
jgi:hypothetical protein